MRAEHATERGLPRAVWALGLTSLFMDTSSELIHGLLPVFLVVTLGASATALGVIEGIAKDEVRLAKLPKALDGFSIVQLSDLHVGLTIDRAFVQRVVDHTLAERAGAD